MNKLIEEQNRGVSVGKDIIYSVLGLFSVGKDANVNFKYKELCGRCGDKESPDCLHEEEYKDHDPYYSSSELEECLKEVLNEIEDVSGIDYKDLKKAGKNTDIEEIYSIIGE